ncbi:hypothetical protein GJ744_008416 [Endocarpon pusillum]|uniref:Bulb-type lectin domain-containing protein n=1 Tax=Endocarpon pusillum TaxID=364733 RepID=A0A8H7E6U8_9EURO|nr:hypothetical protein GJ744_008416 [Endocarpon pusillum]
MCTQTARKPQAHRESSENKSLILQSDGNFVLYNADGDAIWASGSNYEAAQPYVLVQDDGNMSGSLSDEWVFSRCNDENDFNECTENGGHLFDVRAKGKLFD